MANPLTVSEIRERIVAAFARERRWMGFYLSRVEAGLGHSNLTDYCDAFVSLVCRAKLIETGDVGPNGFWQYLHASLLPTPDQLAERTEPAVESGTCKYYMGNTQAGRDCWICHRPPTPRQLAKMARSRKGGAELWHVRSAN